MSGQHPLEILYSVYCIVDSYLLTVANTLQTIKAHSIVSVHVIVYCLLPWAEG